MSTTFAQTPVARPLNEVKRSHVLAVLAACGGNRTLAAQVLHVDRKTLYRMLLRWDADTVANDELARR